MDKKVKDLFEKYLMVKEAYENRVSIPVYSKKVLYGVDEVLQEAKALLREYVRGESPIDYSSDVYGAGIIFIEALAEELKGNIQDWIDETPLKEAPELGTEYYWPSQELKGLTIIASYDGFVWGEHPEMDAALLEGRQCFSTPKAATAAAQRMLDALKG